MVVVMTVAIYTFLRLFEMAQAEASLQSAMPLPEGFWSFIVGVVVVIIVVQIVLQTVLAIGAGGAEAATAQEKAAMQKANGNAYALLVTGVLAVFASLLFNPTPFVMGVLLLLAFVLAELVKFGSQLYYMRRSSALDNLS